MREIEILTLTASEVHAECTTLADILIACVHEGASVSFMAPLSRENAESFWHGVADCVGRGERVLLAATESGKRRILGTVQVLLKQPENQPHRADLAKMLVHPAARRHGIGAQLVRAAEGSTRAAGKSLIVLDTATGSDAERLYERMGWIRVGQIPDYALWPDGRLCNTTIYYKPLTLDRSPLTS